MPALTATLASRTTLAPGIVDLLLAMVDPPNLTFEAGQFVSLAVGQDADGTIVRRSYSIASPCARGERLRLIARIVTGGLASDYLARLPEGATVQMTGPHGFFVLDRRHAGDVVFAATGTGIAPVVPMLIELAGRAEPGRRRVYWGLRHETDLFARDEVEAACAAAGAALLIHLSAPHLAWKGARGRITQAILDALPSLEAPTFYLVGNGVMIRELKAGLVAGGVDRKKQIRTEAFFD